MLLNMLKNDFNRIYTIVKMWNDKVPMWLIVIYYVLTLPIGLLLIVPAMLWHLYILRKLIK
jgi:hypothetical protein